MNLKELIKDFKPIKTRKVEKEVIDVFLHKMVNGGFEWHWDSTTSNQFEYQMLIDPEDLDLVQYV